MSEIASTQRNEDIVIEDDTNAIVTVTFRVRNKPQYARYHTLRLNESLNPIASHQL